MEKKKLEILCTICARGGSKGVYSKNIKNINGRPLISYTIRQAKKAGVFSAIVVSTDSKKISNVAKKYGAHSWFLRPKKYASAIIMDLDTTSPLRDIRDITKSLAIFRASKYKNLVSISSSKKNPYFNMIEKKFDKKYDIVKKFKKKLTRRQDTPKVYDINASIYIWSRKSILNQKKIITSQTGAYLMPSERSIDIDSYLDWKIVEFLLKKKDDL